MKCKNRITAFAIGRLHFDWNKCEDYCFKTVSEIKQYKHCYSLTDRKGKEDHIIRRRCLLILVFLRRIRYSCRVRERRFVWLTCRLSSFFLYLFRGCLSLPIGPEWPPTRALNYEHCPYILWGIEIYRTQYCVLQHLDGAGVNWFFDVLIEGYALILLFLEIPLFPR